MGRGGKWVSENFKLKRQLTLNNQVQKCPTNKRETQTLALSDSGCGEIDRKKREKDSHVKIGLVHIHIQSEKRVRE
jgi:hypothetical protein